MQANKLRRTVLMSFIASLPLLSMGASVHAQDHAKLFSEKELQTAAWLRDTAKLDSSSYRILESLTTEVGPRMAGSAGDARAVAWAEAKFKELGFDKVWKEPVTFPTWTRGVETAEIISPFAQPLVITALGGSVGTAPEGLRAELIQFATLAEMIKAPADQIRGKIVFINHKMRNHTEYGSVGAGRFVGAAEAAKKGAIGLVIRSIGTDSHRMPHTGMTGYEDGVTKIPAAAMSNSDADMVSNMFKRKLPVSLKMTLGSAAGPNYTSYNVIGEITGTEKPDEHVIIGGHLDSWDLGTGAIDDGAGCAISMAAAEMIKRHGIKPKRSIRVVLFANEEQSGAGANAYFEKYKNQISKIQATSEADSGQGPVIRMASFVRPDAYAAVKQMQTVMAPLGVEAGGSDSGGGSDMGELRNLGVASFDLDLRGDDYFDLHHTPDDTFDKIEPARINQAAAAYAVFAWMAAQAPVNFSFGKEPFKKHDGDH
jgi:Zn-dependent M28 family amino/carboxypeptidase